MERFKTLESVAVGRRNNYDIMRFIAAILVIYDHSYPLGAGIGGGDAIAVLTHGKWNSGALGVAIFFIISGFLITQSYERSKNIFIFAKARFLRIYPALIVAILLSAFVLGTLVTSLPTGEYLTNSQTYQYVKALLLYPMQWNLPGVFEGNVYKNSVNGSLWTIPFEVLCYGIVAIAGILGMLRYKTFMVVLFSLTLFVYFFYDQIWPFGKQIFGLQVIDLCQLFCYFSAGMMMYIFRAYIPMNKYFAMFCVVILYLAANYGGLKEFFIIFGSYLTLYVAYITIWKFAEFSRLGDFSYGMYIYAFPVQQAVTYYHGGSMSAPLNFLYSFFITLLLSVLSWHLIEKRALALKKQRFVPEAFVPGVFVTTWTNIARGYAYVLDKLAGIRWWQFAAVFVLLVIAAHFYNEKPAIVTFPYTKSESIFSGGWHPQSPDEAYRWINTSASVQLSKPADAHNVIVEGFVPEAFKEIHHVRLLLNNKQVAEQDISAGQSLQLQAPVHDNLSSYTITIMFDGAHQPGAQDADQRVMSALVSRIAFH
ncbi:acyltransferase [Paenibacillus athensensis]|uniref:Acyltransferase 3 domain-containing protein n=1 Tax=Paenibacillus athensensis TaxID=1967502 RepID=A0A4Y8Q677_9BACL|nr:acyltransferase [Paenibacillus athensensis]MCD1259527.1 acyltransferase [Paenibacillus athensensis]